MSDLSPCQKYLSGLRINASDSALLTIVRVYKLHLLTYLLTKREQIGHSTYIHVWVAIFITVLPKVLWYSVHQMLSVSLRMHWYVKTEGGYTVCYCCWLNIGQACGLLVIRGWSRVTKRIWEGQASWIFYIQYQWTAYSRLLDSSYCRLVHSIGTELNWSELLTYKLTCDKSTQLHDALIGHARQRCDLIDCSKTRTVGVWRVLNFWTRVGLFQCSCVVHTGVRIFTARCYAMSVRHKSAFYRNGWTNRAGFWRVSFLPPVLRCVERKFDYLQK